ncbi:MAG: TrmH family RNA methyltransferase [Bacteroidota bacterium]|nr:TrmH family RNA methyltransferase [Bacteroidota bacterium]
MSKSRVRKKEKRFVVSGERELSRAIEMGYTIETIFFRESYNAEADYEYSEDIYELSTALFDRISMRSGSDKVIAVLESKSHDIKNINVNNDSRVLVVEAPEKPGNIGALIRTAAAASWDAVIIANPKTDLYHPQIIRNSMGGIFSIPIAKGNTKDVISFLEKNAFNISATSLDHKAKHFKRVKYERPLALVFGTEDNGLDQKWLKKAQQIVKIPVKFPIDSLNLSVSAGILIYHCEDL